MSTTSACGWGHPRIIVDVRVRVRPRGRTALRHRVHGPGDRGPQDRPRRTDPGRAPCGARGRAGLMDFALPEELQLLQRSVRAFVEETLVPQAESIETQDRIPREVIDAMAGMGLFGIGFSEAVGGQGFGKLGYCVAVEQLARANASLC